MTTATASIASRWADHLKLQGATNESLPTLGIIPAPSTVSHNNYSVGYYEDKSILIWAKGEGFIVLDDNQTYYRDTVEHLARCLGSFSREQRAEMLQRKLSSSNMNAHGIYWLTAANTRLAKMSTISSDRSSGA